MEFFERKVIIILVMLTLMVVAVTALLLAVWLSVSSVIFCVMLWGWFIMMVWYDNLNQFGHCMSDNYNYEAKRFDTIGFSVLVIIVSVATILMLATLTIMAGSMWPWVIYGAISLTIATVKYRLGSGSLLERLVLAPSWLPALVMEIVLWFCDYWENFVDWFAGTKFYLWMTAERQ